MGAISAALIFGTSTDSYITSDMSSGLLHFQVFLFIAVSEQSSVTFPNAHPNLKLRLWIMN